MRELPPPALVALLERLGLASAPQIQAVYPRVRRLSRDLPRFESVWVDALAQVRALTPFQAAEINAGRGENLVVGPYVLCQRLRHVGYAEVYRAQRIEGGPAVQVIRTTSRLASGELMHRLEKLARHTPGLDHPSLTPIEACGQSAQRAWVGCRFEEGQTAGEWLIHNGRIAPPVVLAIARQMTEALAVVEAEGLAHCDLAANQLVLTPAGRVVLAAPGFRGIVRAAEGLAHDDLPPEAYDYLAPERIERGLPPNVASDIYACGCLWWHLLTGRPPFAGGNSAMKLRAVQSAKLVDVRRYAPETPPLLAATIDACTQRDPGKRSGSFTDLIVNLGMATRDDVRTVAKYLATRPQIRVRPRRRRRPVVAATGSSLTLAAVAGAALTMALVGWPLWQQGLKAPTLSMARPSVPSVTSPKDSEVGSRQDSTTSAVPLGGNRTNVASLPTQVRTEGNTLILPSQHPVRLDAAKLVAGQTVRSKPGSRARIVVPPGGIVIGVEDVTFENVDFVWDSAQAVTANDNETTPLVRLEALGATFRGCGFRVTKAYFKRPTAIYWNTGTRSHDETSLPTGVLKITDCVFEGLAAGIDCRTNGALVFEIENSLHLGPGPLIHLKRIPRVDEPVVADLRRFTLRAAAGLMAFPTDQLTETPGQVRVQATDCAFAPDDEGALFLFNSTDHPCRILETLEWTGQGSLLASGAALARWRHDVGTSEDIADDAIDVAGLVRSEVEFAGEADAGPAASRVTRWQVPLRSTDPPGFGELPEGISGTNR